MTSLYAHVEHIRALLSNGDWTNGMTRDDFDSQDDYDEADSALSWLSDALDVEWTTHADKTFKGARILVAFGGPNIWVNTMTNEVEGFWSGDPPVKLYFGLNDELEEACSEWFACT